MSWEAYCKGNIRYGQRQGEMLREKNGRSGLEVALDWVTLAQPGGTWSSPAGPDHFMTLNGHLSHYFQWHKADPVKNKIQTIYMASSTILSWVPVLSLPNDVSSGLALPGGNLEARGCFGVNSFTGEFIRGSLGASQCCSGARTCTSRTAKKGSTKT